MALRACLKASELDIRLKLTDGGGVDHIIEVGGANKLTKSLNAVKYGGVVNLIG